MNDVFKQGERPTPDKANSRSRAFYLEVLLLLAGFAFVSVVIFQLFGSAYNLSVDATRTENALTSARNVAETFSASQDDASFEAALAGLPGFADVMREGSRVTLKTDTGLFVGVNLSAKPQSAGMMRSASITVFSGDTGEGEPLYSLESEAYESGRGVVA